MAEGLIGNDPDAMNKLAAQMKTAAETIRNAVSGLDGQVNGVAWNGPDARQFKGTDWPAGSKRLIAIATDLDTTSTVITKQASDQVATSAN